MHRQDVHTIDDLDDREQLALGGLIRVLIRLDGSFSEEEEAYLTRVAESIGGADALWKVISRSAQELPDDDAIREAARAVQRPGAQALIRQVLEGIARAETITLAEQKLLDWLDDLWGMSGETPPAD